MKSRSAMAAGTVWILLAGLLGCADETPPPESPASSDASPPRPELAPGAPRLVLFLVVDQGRGDYLERFRPLFRGGLRRLLEESIVFTDAHHDHAMTSTSPGHATLSTGVHPARHGIVGNYWFDRARGEEVYSVRDEDDERTPERLLAPTFGDWLKAASPASKVFAASGKDRAAILTAGKEADAAFWFDPASGDFTTAPHDSGTTRPWLDEFHATRHVDRRFGELWEPLPEVVEHGGEYGIGPLDEGLFQTRFPRPLGRAELLPHEDFYRSVYRSPVVDRYLADFVMALVEGEELGRDDVPDLLGVSFSALDTVGHGFGPQSPELLDTLLRLDRILGELLDFVDREIGLGHVVVSLSSDHGVTPIPEQMLRRGERARRFGGEEIACFQRAGRKLREELGDEDWLAHEDFYLDWELAAARGVERKDLEEAIRRHVEGCPGVARVRTRSELTALGPLGGDRGGEHGHLPPDDPLARLYVHNLHPERSPDVFVELEPHTLTSWSSRTNHGSPYRYDTWVPWLLRLPEGRGTTVSERVYTVDVAPTLAARIGLATPEDLDGVDRGPLFGAE